MKDITPFVKNYRELTSRLWNERVRERGGFLSEWDDCDEAEDRCVELFRREVLDPVDPTLPDKTPEYMASKDPNPRLAVVPASGARVQIGGLDGRQDPVPDRLDPALVPRTAFLFVTLFDFEIRGERTFDYCWTRIADCPDASLVGLSALIPFESCTFVAMDEGDTRPQPAWRGADPATPSKAAQTTTVSFSKMIEDGEDEAFLALAAEAPERLDSRFETPLAAAISARRADLCRALLDRGCDPDASPTGTDPLELCLQQEGDPPLDILAMLLDRSRYPVDDQRPSGSTLLHGAVAWGCLAAVPFLMSRGARLSDMDIDCETVEQTALETGGRPLLDRLREMEAAVSATNDPSTPASHADSAEGAKEPAP